jgi:hypothetical protein
MINAYAKRMDGGSFARANSAICRRRGKPNETLAIPNVMPAGVQSAFVRTTEGGAAARRQ